MVRPMRRMCSLCTKAEVPGPSLLSALRRTTCNRCGAQTAMCTTTLYMRAFLSRRKIHQGSKLKSDRPGHLVRKWSPTSDPEGASDPAKCYMHQDSQQSWMAFESSQELLSQCLFSRPTESLLAQEVHDVWC